MRALPSRRRGFALLPIAILLAVIALVWWQSHNILAGAGNFLDVGEPPQKADTAVVLAGGWTGERVLRAGQLVRQGVVPYALLSSSATYYGLTECECESTFAARNGYPPEMFQCLLVKASSTREEAQQMVQELRRRGVRKCLIVSVDTHLRRARRIFTSAAPEIEFHMVSASSPNYQLSNWYKSREGRKAVFLEWTKVVTDLVGL
jgi:uncharacterized SAM-binding protein YcdF (DUF218 family)